MTVLKEMQGVQCTAEHVMQVPGIIHTLRKVRNYRPSLRVQKRANEVYAKFKALFVRPQVVKTARGKVSYLWHELQDVVCSVDNVETQDYF